MTNERNGYELLRAFWQTLRALEDLDVNVAAPYVLLAADRLVAGESTDTIAADVRLWMPPHLQRRTSPADRLVLRARERRHAARGDHAR